MKQKRAKPGDSLADDSTEIGSEDLNIPDISDVLKQAEEILSDNRQEGRKRRWIICPMCGVPGCPYGRWVYD